MKIRKNNDGINHSIEDTKSKQVIINVESFSPLCISSIEVKEIQQPQKKLSPEDFNQVIGKFEQMESRPVLYEQTNLFSITHEKGFAVISACENYRYLLYRQWDYTLQIVLFIMLNPSTADAQKDDATIRRCRGFAKSWGYGGFVVCNLFAYRSTDPIVLQAVENPYGSYNEVFLKHAMEICDITVCAWGNVGVLKKIPPIFNTNKNLHCIKLSKDGTPMHPLYLPKNLKPIPFEYESKSI